MAVTLIGLAIAGGVGLVARVAKAIPSAHLAHWAIVSLVVFAGAVIYWLSIACSRRWWVVPAGLVCRRSLPWKRRVRLTYVRAREGILLLDLQAGYGNVACAGKMHYLPEHSVYVALAVVAAWLSPLHGPTPAEIKAVLPGELDGRTDRVNPAGVE